MLRELQRAIGASVLADFSAPPPSGVIAGEAGRAAARFAVHRGTVLESLVAALGAAFPVCKKIAGDENFRVLAGHHVRERPPRRPQLSVFGQDFADFVGGFAPALRDYPFLSELARLEWALHDSYLAADAPALATETLAAIEPDRLPRMRFAPHPAARLVVSTSHPLWHIWSREAAPEPGMERGESVLVARPSDRVEAYALMRGEAEFVEVLLARAPLGCAANAAFTAAPEFDLMAAIAAALARGAFGAEIVIAPEDGGNR